MPTQNIIKLNISRHQKAVMSPKKGTRPVQIRRAVSSAITESAPTDSRTSRPSRLASWRGCYEESRCGVLLRRNVARLSTWRIGSEVSLPS